MQPTRTELMAMRGVSSVGYHYNPITAWQVRADGTVLFRNISGQPHVERLVKERNPLGPFQPAGEGAGAVLLR